MRSRLRVAALAAAAVLVVACWIWGPLVLRRIDWFRVRHVEVTGARLLAPSEVVEAAAVTEGQNLWDDRAAWRSGLLAHPAIRAVAISRRIPGTLRIRIEEERPVAYVEAGTLRLATAAGEILPVDPRRAAVDLPIVRASWSDSAGVAQGRRMLAELARLRRLDPTLVAEVSEISVAAVGPGALLLSHRIADVVIPEGIDAVRLAELRAVLSDVEARLGARPAAGQRPRLRLDARFRDQIVVRYPTSV